MVVVFSSWSAQVYFACIENIPSRSGAQTNLIARDTE